MCRHGLQRESCLPAMSQKHHLPRNTSDPPKPCRWQTSKASGIKAPSTLLHRPMCMNLSELSWKFLRTHPTWGSCLAPSVFLEQPALTLLGETIPLSPLQLGRPCREQGPGFIHPLDTPGNTGRWACFQLLRPHHGAKTTGRV